VQEKVKYLAENCYKSISGHARETDYFSVH